MGAYPLKNLDKQKKSNNNNFKNDKKKSNPKILVGIVVLALLLLCVPKTLISHLIPSFHFNLLHAPQTVGMLRACRVGKLHVASMSEEAHTPLNLIFDCLSTGLYY